MKKRPNDDIPNAVNERSCARSVSRIYIVFAHLQELKAKLNIAHSRRADDRERIDLVTCAEEALLSCFKKSAPRSTRRGNLLLVLDIHRTALLWTPPCRNGRELRELVHRNHVLCFRHLLHLVSE